jgi:hypothetical protein
MTERIAAVFLMRIGKKFWVTSSTHVHKSVARHKSHLVAGIHADERLQETYDLVGGEIGVEIVKVVPKKPIDLRRDHRRRLRLHEQWELDKHYGKVACLNTNPSSGFTKYPPKVRPREVGPRQRSITKRIGAYKKHPHSKACVIVFEGQRFHFPSINDAASHFKVYQPTMALWLKGKLPWPSLEKKVNGKSKIHAHLGGMTGWLVGDGAHPKESIEPA